MKQKTKRNWKLKPKSVGFIVFLMVFFTILKLNHFLDWSWVLAFLFIMFLGGVFDMVLVLQGAYKKGVGK